MLKPHPSRVFDYTKDQEIQNFLADWIFHSHNWVEVHPGYYKCEWCKTQHTSEMPIVLELGSGGFEYVVQLCPKNPIIRKLVDDITLGDQSEET